MRFFEKKVAFQVIDFASFLPYIWRGIYKPLANAINAKKRPNICTVQIFVVPLQRIWKYESVCYV